MSKRHHNVQTVIGLNHHAVLQLQDSMLRVSHINTVDNECTSTRTATGNRTTFELSCLPIATQSAEP